VAIELLALSTFPLAWRLFRNLPDRGYGVSKIFAILLVGYSLWLGTSFGLLRNDRGGALLALLAVTGASWLLSRSAWRQRRGGARLLIVWLRSRRLYVAAIEGLFLVAFAGWTLVRAHDPSADHTEQPMDLLFLSAISTSPTFPPRDPWLAGYAVSYYYFGYWLVGLLARLAGQPSEVAYNLGQACWFGLVVTACYALGSNLVVLERVKTAWRFGGYAFVAGLLTLVGVTLIGNLDGLAVGLRIGVGILRGSIVIEGSGSLAAHAGSWWWWPSSRVLHDVDLHGRRIEIIDEFPFFSYLLGDAHPHLLATPFVLLVASLALNLCLGRHRRGQPSTATRRPWLAAAARFLDLPHGHLGFSLAVLAVGGLLFVNPWDVPGALMLLAVAYTLAGGDRSSPGAASPWRLLRAAAIGVAVLVGAAIFYFPYLLSAQSQADGVLPNLFNPTPISQLLRMFGVFAPGIIALLWCAWREQPPVGRRLLVCLTTAFAMPVASLAVGALWALGTVSGRGWLDSLQAPVTVSGALSIVLGRWATGWVTATVVSASLGLTATLLFADAEGGVPRRPAIPFALLLLMIGLGLVLMPELFYVRDAFGTRMNTVFKFYYEAWLLLAVASVYGMITLLRTRGVPSIFAAGGLGLLLLSLVYPVTTLYERMADTRSREKSLDALAYVGYVAPDEMAAIQWVRQSTRPDSRVIQGAGTSYRPDECRISVATGRSTLLGWEGHERQWRGTSYGRLAEGRKAALEEIYSGSSPDRLRQALEAWAVDYVFVGPRERDRYMMTAAGEARLDEVMELAFHSGHVRIYRRRG
jgi:YYY domain-containing protein